MALTGVVAAGAVQKAGDVMTGQLTLAVGSSMTVTGAVGIGGSGLSNGTTPVADFRNNAGTSLLQVQQGGNVGIGTAAPDMKLSVNGNANNTTGVWAVFSDRRLKRDIAPIHGALETLSKLQGVSFNWKDPKKDADLGRVREENLALKRRLEALEQR